MNVYDSQQMVKLMKPFGYQPGEEVDDADMVILNTCHIREKAAEKVYSDLGRIRAHKNKLEAKGRNMVIVVAGCVGQAEGKEIFRRAPYVDIVVGPHSYTNLPELLSHVKREQSHQIDLEFQENTKFDRLTNISEQQEGPAAFLSIQEGCDKFCTFCVVPYTRGKEFSRPVEHIYREAMELQAQGAKEITLLGQNVNAYHGVSSADERTFSLGELIDHVSTIDGIERIRYTTSHPKDMHEGLYKAHADNPKLMPFIHLPVQAGSNNMLKRMNRKHTRDSYFEKIDRLREARPDIAFSSDFIVGFPGETDQDFEDTMDLVRRVGYAQCYSFKYSPRPGTPAAEMDEQVPEEVKTERLMRLQDLLNEQQFDFNRKYVGKTMRILLDRKGKIENQLVGKTEYMQSVHINDATDYAIGDMVDVHITEAFPNSLTGNVV